MEINYTLIRAISILTSIYVIRLIYTQRLRIGYSWFLFLLGIGFLILSVWPGSINLLGLFTGSDSWLNNVLFFLVIFLFIIVVHCTIMISALTDRVKELGQQIAISFAEIDEKNLNKLISSLKVINASITHMNIDEKTSPICHDSYKTGDLTIQSLGENHTELSREIQNIHIRDNVSSISPTGYSVRSDNENKTSSFVEDDFNEFPNDD